MILLACITFGMLVLVCVVAVCVSLAKDGYEGADGFHAIEPPPVSAAVVVSREMKIEAPKQQAVPSGLELAAE